MSMILETERLILRGWTEDDASVLFKYAKDKRVGPAAGWPAHKSKDYSLAVIRTVLAKDEVYAICLKGGNNEPIGSIGLTFSDSSRNATNKGEAELGYWVGYPYWRKGIATEAASEVIRHGFVDLGLDKIFCAYFCGNEQSKRVQEKCGFKPHHINEKCEVKLLDEVRIEQVNVLTKGDFELTKKV